MRYKLIFGIIILISSFSLLASPPQSFSEAKKQAKQIFSEHRITIYCGCKYDKHGTVNHKSCNMHPTKHIKRAKKIEWEHIMPMQHAINHFECGRTPICEKSNGKKYKGRACCRKISKKFRELEAELFNLWPAVGSVNLARGCLKFGSLHSGPKEPKYNFDGCKIIIDKSTSKSVEPRNEVKGLVARANLFMSDKYDIKLSASQKRLFEHWNKTFPPDAWEFEWESKVSKIEGYHNPYITEWQSKKK